MFYKFLAQRRGHAASNPSPAVLPISHSLQGLRSLYCSHSFRALHPSYSGPSSQSCARFLSCSSRGIASVAWEVGLACLRDEHSLAATRHSNCFGTPARHPPSAGCKTLRGRPGVIGQGVGCPPHPTPLHPPRYHELCPAGLPGPEGRGEREDWCAASVPPVRPSGGSRAGHATTAIKRGEVAHR